MLAWEVYVIAGLFDLRMQPLIQCIKTADFQWQRDTTAFKQLSCAWNLSNRCNTVLHSGRTFWGLCNTDFSEQASYLAREAVLLQPTMPPSAPNTFLTPGSDRGLSVSSRMLRFKDVNSRSGIWYLGCALLFSYSHYQHVGDSPCQHRVTCSQGPKRFWLHY